MWLKCIRTVRMEEKKHYHGGRDSLLIRMLCYFSRFFDSCSICHYICHFPRFFCHFLNTWLHNFNCYYVPCSLRNPTLGELLVPYNFEPLLINSPAGVSALWVTCGLPICPAWVTQRAEGRALVLSVWSWQFLGPCPSHQTQSPSLPLTTVG